MIVDLDRDPRPKTALRPPLMGVALGAIAIGLGALVLRPAADPADTAAARDRINTALVVSTAEPPPMTIVPVRTARPASVLPGPRATLPPSLMFPVAVAEALPKEDAEAAQALVLSAGEGTRQVAYRMPDGRTVVVRQSQATGRPLLPAYSLDEGSVRGYPAQFITTRQRSLRSMIAWSEGPATYLMYSGSMTIRDLVRLADQLR